MTSKLSYTTALAALALSLGILGGIHSTVAAEIQPTYESSIKVIDQNDGESGEAAILASQAKIDVTQATSFALAQVPGTVLSVALDNENGSLVYSVEIKTASNELKDVKVDAGDGKVLSVDVGAEDTSLEEADGGDEQGGTEGDQENN